MPADHQRPDWLTQQRLEVGRSIRAHREWANLSQEELAGRLGVERRTIVRLELGTSSPPLDRILHIAHVLGIPPADLMPEE